ncbi:tRNA lysidine(34) synthetase TilS [Candidatus Saccharibacteria bacterium]|nr:tRNA lysidine(34) synthetase TilS [Candidatus Saccharibacteria bacterium]
MKYLLAVSGGVDSMVLFDIYKKENIVVAHFNHKLRPSADDDEEFVRKTCQENKVRFEVGYLELKPGEKISEERARAERYKFLNQIKAQLEQESPEKVKICTAHHLDDLAETVMINLIRGTAWRGLTPFSSEVYRPFIQDDDILKPESKADILVYASRNKIHFREDPTNFEPDFLRNRVREKLSTLDPEEKYQLNQKIKQLWKRQTEIRKEIETILEEITEQTDFKEQGIIERNWFYDLDEKTALEILKYFLNLKNISLTTPQLKDFFDAIKNYIPEKRFNLPGDRLVTIHKTYLKF